MTTPTRYRVTWADGRHATFTASELSWRRDIPTGASVRPVASETLPTNEEK